MTNGDNAGTFYELYFLTPKVATDSSPESDWENAGEAAGPGIPRMLFHQTGQLPVRGWVPNTLVGTKPTQFENFRKKWEVLGMQDFYIPMGGTHQTETTVGVNKIINRTTVDENSNTYIPRVSILVMMVQRGITVYNNDSGAGTFSSCQTPYTVSAKVNFRDHHLGPTQVSTNVGWSEQFIQTAKTSQKIINVEGVVQDIIQVT